MVRFQYDRRHYPPALVVNVRLANLAETIQEEIEAKIDTGAALSAVPHSLRDRLGLSTAEKVRARGPFDHRYQERVVYGLKLQVPWRQDRWIRVKALLTEGEWFLLGRNILNQFVLRADGPQGVFEIR